MPLLESEDREKSTYHGDSVEEITAEMRERNAERLDVSEDELEKMPLSEVRDRIEEKKAEKESDPWWKLW